MVQQQRCVQHKKACSLDAARQYRQRQKYDVAAGSASISAGTTHRIAPPGDVQNLPRDHETASYRHAQWLLLLTARCLQGAKSVVLDKAYSFLILLGIGSVDVRRPRTQPGCLNLRFRTGIWNAGRSGCSKQ